MNNNNEIHARELVALTGCVAMLHYDIAGLPGAVDVAYLDSEVAEQLTQVQRNLEELSAPGRRYGLLIWDAFRTQVTQQAIFDAYAAVLAETRGIDDDAARLLAAEYVTPPQTVFPHGTGGAVDLTLLVNGEVADMGTNFDSFTPRSHKDFFRDNPPETDADRDAHLNRETLRAAMEDAGFVGLDHEWWHYEYGTAFWAARTGRTQILHATHPCAPHTDRVGPAYRAHVAGDVQPIRYSGVAQRFRSSTDRAAALRGETGDHYYARTGHPTLTGLARRLSGDMVVSEYCSLVASGMNAARTALIARMPRGGTLVCDQRVYYEVGAEIGRLAEENQWVVRYGDLTDIGATATLVEGLRRQGRPADVLYCDSPMNWWLDAIDLPAIKGLVAADGTTVIVDISVQPMREYLLADADVAVCSLSKYPSTGVTLGGAVFTNDAAIHAQIEASIARGGNRMSSETAATIWEHAMFLDDRLGAVQTKLLGIEAAVRDHPAVRGVRRADPELCGGRCGGMLVLEMQSPALGAALEAMVSHNVNTTITNLHLAYTFGGFLTTIEHFASNPRPAAANLGLRAVPDSFVRLGIGCERQQAITADLLMALNCVGTLAPARVAA